MVVWAQEVPRLCLPCISGILIQAMPCPLVWTHRNQTSQCQVAPAGEKSNLDLCRKRTTQQWHLLLSISSIPVHRFSQFLTLVPGWVIRSCRSHKTRKRWQPTASLISSFPFPIMLDSSGALTHLVSTMLSCYLPRTPFRRDNCS